MHRAAGIARLLHLLNVRVLPGLRTQDCALLELFNAMRCSVATTANEINLQFAIGDLLNALWRLAEEDGAELHDADDWQADVRELSLQLMNPWPDAKLREHAALVKKIKVREHGPAHANEYVLSIARNVR